MVLDNGDAESWLLIEVSWSCPRKESAWSPLDGFQIDEHGAEWF